MAKTRSEQGGREVPVRREQRRSGREVEGRGVPRRGESAGRGGEETARVGERPARGGEGAARTEMTVREKRELQQQEGTREGPYFEPNVDIYETEESLTLMADVPGTGAEDIEVDLRDNLLTLTGLAQAVDQRWRPLYQEYRLGNYLRQFRLGQQIDQDRISAQVKDGVLTLTLPKAESALPKKIQVQAR